MAVITGDVAVATSAGRRVARREGFPEGAPGRPAEQPRGHRVEHPLLLHVVLLNQHEQRVAVIDDAIDVPGRRGARHLVEQAAHLSVLSAHHVSRATAVHAAGFLERGKQHLFFQRQVETHGGVEVRAKLLHARLIALVGRSLDVGPQLIAPPVIGREKHDQARAWIKEFGVHGGRWYGTPMSFDQGMRGLSLDQAPPLAVPMSFFLTAPLSLCAAGVVIASAGTTALASRLATATAAAVHLGTLGYLVMVMFGALYQMLPVVAGAPVPGVRLAHAVHALLVAGAATLVFALTTGRPFALAAALLVTAFVGFLVPAAIAAARARVQLDTVPGMRLVLPALVFVLGLGVEMSLARAGIHAVPNLQHRLLAHVGIGLVAWVGGLIVAVSWQVVPMFYLTAPFPRWVRITSLVLLGTTILGVLAATFADAALPWIAGALLPGALAVWALHPVVALVLIVRRRRRRVGESVRFWFAALATAPLVLAAGVAAFISNDPRMPVLFGWLALVGWASLIVHGMLTRIVPFLVWFHRYSKQVGLADIPAMRTLLPDRRARVGLVLHVATALVGVLAIVLQRPSLTVAAGLGLCATGLAMFVSFVRALLHPAARLLPVSDAMVTARAGSAAPANHRPS